MTTEAPQSSLTPPSFLATRPRKLILALLCAVAFLDFVDASITNVTLPPGFAGSSPAAKTWSVYGAKRTQPVATSRKRLTAKAAQTGQSATGGSPRQQFRSAW